MAQSDKDDLADALARLASGEVAPSEHEPPAPVDGGPRLSAEKPLRAAAPIDRFGAPPMPQPPQLATPIEQAGLEFGPEPAEDEIVDDDTVPVPAPDVTQFAPPPTSHRAAVYQTLEFSRTLIPVLLTCGVLLVALASARHLVGQYSPLTDLPPWLAPLLFLTGLVLLVLAVLNMLSVKRRIAEHALRVDKLRRRLL
jgi:hypothetical protein